MNSNFEILKEFLEVPLESSDLIFERFASIPNADIVWRGEQPKRFLFLRGQRQNKVLLVAHADTVWFNLCGSRVNTKHELVFSDGVIRSDSNNYGIGADDRAGCAMLWLLKDLGHSLLITDGEEFGRLGSTWLMNAPENSDIAQEINAEHQFMIQLDRRNGFEFKCYSVGTNNFRDYIQRVTGYSEPNRSSYTDIVTLCRDITGVNLSIGYRNEHSSSECLHLAEWQNTLEICWRWLSDPDLPRFNLRESDSFSISV